MNNRKYQDDDISIWGNEEPVCPFCGENQETTDLMQEFNDLMDEEPIDIRCQSCDEEFKVQLNVSVKFNTFVDKT